MRTTAAESWVDIACWEATCSDGLKRTQVYIELYSASALFRYLFQRNLLKIASGCSLEIGVVPERCRGFQEGCSERCCRRKGMFAPSTICNCREQGHFAAFYASKCVRPPCTPNAPLWEAGYLSATPPACASLEIQYKLPDNLEII